MAGEVERIAPLVDKHEVAYNQATGVAWLWKGIWAVVGGAIVAGIIWGLSHLGWRP